MNKTELIKALSEVIEETQKRTKEIVDAMQNVVFDQLADGEEVKVFDGITLSTKFVDSTERRNPATGETVMSQPHNKPVCKFGKAIKEAIN